MEAINRFAKTALTAEEVYTFSVILCDNEVDRDGECFSLQTLQELRELFVGKTGICDHDWKSGNQKARIYRTEVMTDPNRKTMGGEDAALNFGNQLSERLRVYAAAAGK